MKWLFDLWCSLNWNGERTEKKPGALRRVSALPPTDKPDEMAVTKWRNEFWRMLGVYAALVIFGWTVPDAVYQDQWAQAFTRGMTAVTPQITNIQSISGVRYGQNQYLFAVLWALAIPVCAVSAFSQRAEKWRFPILREHPSKFLAIFGCALLFFFIAYSAFFTELEVGASRVSRLLLTRFSTALAAPFFVFAPLMSALFFANYLVRLGRANFFLNKEGT